MLIRYGNVNLKMVEKLLKRDRLSWKTWVKYPRYCVKQIDKSVLQELGVKVR